MHVQDRAKFEWRIEKTENEGIYKARYGYWERYPAGKRILGMGIELLTEVFTLGFVGYNPYPPNAERGAYYTFLADVKNGKVQRVKSEQ